MPISHISSTSLLLTGLCQGNLSRVFLYHTLLIFSLAISLACDPSDLPRGTRITPHGPVLKVLCEPGLQAFEMVPTSTSISTGDDKNGLLPTPTKRKFARFICMYGSTYQRINPEGVDPTLFFCADKMDTECDDLEYSSEHGHLLKEGTVAAWRPTSSNESQSRVLYCLHGTWYHLDGESLPEELTVKYKLKKDRTAYSPRMTTVTPTTRTTKAATKSPSNTIEKNLEAIREPIPQNAEAPTKKSVLFNPFHLPSLYKPTFLRSRITTTMTPKPSTIAEREEFQNTHFPQRDIIVIGQGVFLALHDSLHKFTRIAFYCMLVIGIITLLICLIIFCYICRRRALLATSANEAQKRLRRSISVV